MTSHELQNTIVDHVMALSSEELTAMSAVARHKVSMQWSTPLGSWLDSMIEEELARREGRVANYPTTLVENEWTPTEVAGAMSLAVVWATTPTSGRLERLVQKILQCVLAHVCSRLLEYEDMKLGV